MIYLSATIRSLVLPLGILLLIPRISFGTDNTYLRFHTSLGNIDVLMLSDEAPNTVAQFNGYLTSGVLTDSIIHRSATNLDPTLNTYVPFVIQGGGFYLQNDVFPPLYQVSPPASTLFGEPGVSNKPGTLAMALSTGKDSATNEWYFNAADNSALLDGTADGGPFTVFGASTNISSLAVIEAIALTHTYDGTSYFQNNEFGSLPLINYDSTVGLVAQDFVTIFSIAPLTVQTFSAWQNTNFPGQQNGDGASTATPRNDGVPNILKFLCDINPITTMTAADYARLPKLGRASITTVVNATNVTTNYITLTYQQRDAIAGVVVNLQTSSDLKTWTTPASPFVAESGTDTVTGDPIVTYRVATTTGTDLFLRLNVTMP